MGGSSGGKGDKQSSTMALPKFVEDFAKANMAKADRASQIGYAPYQGPTVQALNEQQIGAMEQNEAAMRAFGMGGGPGVRASIPTPTTYAGGVQGYDPMALYMEALGKMDPAQRAAIESFSNPQAAMQPNGQPRQDWSAGGRPVANGPNVMRGMLGMPARNTPGGK